MKEWVPYTYLLTEKKTGIRYYGSKYAKGCNPADLGVTYFTSSEAVEPLFRSHPENFKIEIRRTFSKDDPLAARRWEAKFLQRIDAAHNPSWYNKHNDDGKFTGNNAGKEFSAIWRKHCSEGQFALYASGYVHPMKGKKFPEEVRQNMSKSRIKQYKDKTKHPKYGKKVNQDGRRRMSISGERAWKEKKQNGIIRAWKIPPLARKWTLISPEGQEFCIEGNLELLCKQHGLSQSIMIKTVNGVLPQKGKCIGWKLIRGPRVHASK